MRRSWRTLIVLAACLCGALSTSQASAYHGSSLSASTGLWAPLLPASNVGAVSYDQEDLGIIFGVVGRHRFEGYRTSIEGDVNYGTAGDTDMLSYGIQLRDTWQFGSTGLSAGLGYSAMNFDQEFGPGPSKLESDLQGAKIFAGWEGFLGRNPSWLDFTVGLYNLDASYRGNIAPTTVTTTEFTTSLGLDYRTQSSFFGIPVSPSIGVQYFTDMPQWTGTALTTSEAVILTGKLEFLLW